MRSTQGDDVAESGLVAGQGVEEAFDQDHPARAPGRLPIDGRERRILLSRKTPMPRAFLNLPCAAPGPEGDDVAFHVVERADDAVIERFVPLTIKDAQLLQPVPLRGGELGQALSRDVAETEGADSLGVRDASFLEIGAALLAGSQVLGVDVLQTAKQSQVLRSESRGRQVRLSRVGSVGWLGSSEAVHG